MTFIILIVDLKTILECFNSKIDVRKMNRKLSQKTSLARIGNLEPESLQ